MHELQVEFPLAMNSPEPKEEHCTVGSVRACELP